MIFKDRAVHLIIIRFSSLCARQRRRWHRSIQCIVTEIERTIESRGHVQRIKEILEYMEYAKKLFQKELMCVSIQLAIDFKLFERTAL